MKFKDKDEVIANICNILRKLEMYNNNNDPLLNSFFVPNDGTYVITGSIAINGVARSVQSEAVTLRARDVITSKIFSVYKI